MNRSGNSEGFRTPQQKDDELRRANREAGRRINAGEFADNMIKVEDALEKFKNVLNDRIVKNEALVKTLIDSGVLNEDAYKVNMKGIKSVQNFMSTVDVKRPMLDRVRDVIKFNTTQPAEFRITDKYFPVRNWLVLNPDGLSLDEIAEISLALGFDDIETYRTMRDVKVMETKKAMGQ